MSGKSSKVKELWNRLKEKLRRHKGKAVIGGGGGVLGGYGLYRWLGGEKQLPNQPELSSFPIEAFPQPQPKSTAKPQVKKESQFDKILQGSAGIPDLLTSTLEKINNERDKVINAMLNLQQEMEKDYQEYQAIVDDLNSKTAKLTNAIITFLAKQGFGAYLDTDFSEHIANTIIYTPANVLPQVLEKVSKGYFIAKTTGLDTSGLSYVNFIDFADNPNLTKTLEPKFIAGVEVISKTLANQYTSYLNDIKLKQDQKKTQLLILDKVGDILQNKAINLMQQTNTLIDLMKAQADTFYKQRSLDITEWYKKALIGLQSQKQENKETGLADIFNVLIQQSQQPTTTQQIKQQNTIQKPITNFSDYGKNTQKSSIQLFE